MPATKPFMSVRFFSPRESFLTTKTPSAPKLADSRSGRDSPKMGQRPQTSAPLGKKDRAMSAAFFVNVLVHMNGVL